MPQCAGITRSGSRCKTIVSPGVEHCFNHDPDRAEERRRNASKAGKSSGPNKEVVGVKRQLQELVDKVLDKEIGRADAAVAGQLLNIKLRAIDVERKQREAEEFEERLEALEARLGGVGTSGARRGPWGAG